MVRITNVVLKVSCPLCKDKREELCLTSLPSSSQLLRAQALSLSRRGGGPVGSMMWNLAWVSHTDLAPKVHVMAPTAVQPKPRGLHNNDGVHTWVGVPPAQMLPHVPALLHWFAVSDGVPFIWAECPATKCASAHQHA